MYIQTPHQSHRYAFKCNINSVKSKIYDWNKTHSEASCQYSFVSCKCDVKLTRDVVGVVLVQSDGGAEVCLSLQRLCRRHQQLELTRLCWTEILLLWGLSLLFTRNISVSADKAIVWQNISFTLSYENKAAVLICSLTCWHPLQCRRRSRGGEGGDKERRERGETWRHTELQLESHTTSPARIRYKKEKVSSAVWRRERWEVWFLWLVLDTRPESLSSL